MNPQKLLAGCLKLLSVRPRSQKEIREFLQRKTSDGALIDQTVAKLQELKLINDSEFAKWLVESRSRTRPRGLRLLNQELKQKGIDTNIDINEAELAKIALGKKKNIKSRDQAIRFLQYRGFAWDSIAKAVKSAYNDGDVN